MVLFKRCTTVLLAVIFFSLVSISTTQIAHAESVFATGALQGKVDSQCPISQYFVLPQSSCKISSLALRTHSKKENPKTTQFAANSQIIPTTISTPFSVSETPAPTITSEPTHLPKPEEKPQEVTPSPVDYQIELPVPTATLSADVLFDLVNQHRKNISLPPLEHDGGVCAVAESRRDEIAQEIFVTHHLHAGFWSKNLPYWATENLIWQHTEVEALNWWLHSPIHRAAIEGSYKYACGVCVGQVCNMVFTSYEPKVASANPQGNLAKN